MAKKTERKSKSEPAAKAAATLATPKAATIAAVARHFEVHERTIKSWFAKGCPRDKGAYDIDAIAAWREANLGVAEADETSDKRGLWETRRSRAAALKAELELQAAQGRLIEVDQAARIVGQHIAEVKAHLNQLPNFAASLVKLKGAQKKPFLDAMAKKIRKLCDGFEEALTELAKAVAAQKDAEE